jgi:integrase
MVDKIVARTRRQVGFHFTAHQLRHSYATLAYRDGVALEVIVLRATAEPRQPVRDLALRAPPT